MPERILVIEDEQALRETLSYNLEKEGYAVQAVGDGHVALEAARAKKPDLIVLDLMLPGLDGFEITRILRRESNIPILMLTARDEEIDRVLGLEMGADDYMTKPFSMREFMARVKATLRRVRLMREESGSLEDEPKKVLEFEDLVIDTTRHEVLLSEDVIPLKPREYDLLLFLARHKGQVMSRSLILERVWGWDFDGGTRTVDVHVRWLRSKLEEDASKPTRIVTVRGAGYRFDG
ncbi:MAG: DNA-binding response regulator [Chloroflexi bacterium]|nr:MAG: DNA-binding response regulator [Chloroflexota bacterium]MBL1193760.1 DNA-binding response regulator [Chloroflexota bacterium]NOH11053.1 response regulator transcription factor [Chloroflexota bacterium]